MKAKEYLSQVKKLNVLIQNKLFEKEQLLALATSVTQKLSAERVQTSPNPDKMTDAVHKIIMVEAETDALIDKYVDIKREVIMTIERLSAGEYDLLHKVYIQGCTLDEYAITCDKSYGWAKNKHSRALKKVQRMINGRERKQ